MHANSNFIKFFLEKKYIIPRFFDKCISNFLKKCIRFNYVCPQFSFIFRKLDMKKEKGKITIY
jgi:hypothetical protein